MRHMAYLRRSGEWSFFNIRQKDDEDYLWGRFKQEKGVLIFWMPSHAKFMELVEKQQLSAEVSENNIRIIHLTKSQEDYITSNIGGSLFQWDSPGVIVRHQEGAQDSK